jgi:hypothetical protein
MHYELWYAISQGTTEDWRNAYTLEVPLASAKPAAMRETRMPRKACATCGMSHI